MFSQTAAECCDVINGYDGNFLDVIAVVESVVWVWRVHVLYRKWSYQYLEVKPHSPD